jgi:hypothetical protein
VELRGRDRTDRTADRATQANEFDEGFAAIPARQILKQLGRYSQSEYAQVPSPIFIAHVGAGRKSEGSSTLAGNVTTWLQSVPAVTRCINREVIVETIWISLAANQFGLADRDDFHAHVGSSYSHA